MHYGLRSVKMVKKFALVFILFLFVFRAAHILLDDFVVLYLDGKSSSLEEAVDVSFRPFEVSNLRL